MIMRTRSSGPEGTVKLLLNLRHKEIEVRFPSVLQSTKGVAIREYRFRVSLDQTFSLSQFQESNGKTSLILHLTTPPPFSKKLKEAVLTTHDPKSRRWIEDDMWLRQTVVVDHKDEFTMIKGTPVSLNNGDCSINIGRWTTYLITLNDTTHDAKFRIIMEALRDFNVPITTIDRFSYSAAGPLIWDSLDGHIKPQMVLSESQAKEFSLEEEFSTISLPFGIRYLLDACISNGRLNEYVIDDKFLRVLSDMEERKARQLLDYLLDLPPEMIGKLDLSDPTKIAPFPRRQPKLPENCVLVHSATVTATTIIFNPPSVEITNRIIRQFRYHSDRFLRVRFEDDKYRGNSKIHATTSRKMDEIFTRVHRTLTRGISQGDRHYEFLAWGNSQLREHSAYFFASLPGVVTASQIRAIMGEFDHETIIAKRAARMGQCFSTTRAISYRVPRVTRADLISDVKRNGFTFTDGVGKISPFLAEMVALQLKLTGPTPSCFQFRLGGCKGVLAVSKDLPGIDIKIRESQFKFPSEALGLEVIRCSEFWRASLNRQIITVLSALGVEDKTFLEMQEKAIATWNEAMHSDEVAVKELTDRVDPNHKTLDIKEMVSSGFRKANEPFVTSLLRLWRSWSLKYLREKAKLPIIDGACVLGCVDETATLRGHFNELQPQTNAIDEDKINSLPEVFIQVSRTDTECEVIEGCCLIARNPSLYEGDIRMVRAVNTPALSHLQNVLVFPQTGDRDLSNMCSGGDLDGDDYIVIWDKRLFPKIWNPEPMDFTPPPPMRAAGDITTNDIITFFLHYMKNDFLGKIAHAHLGWADDLDEGIRSPQCLELAHLHSMAVDYAKTGQPAKFPKDLERFEWPHFMEKKSGRPYHSRKVLGQLYDAVKAEPAVFEPNYGGIFDKRILNACDPSLGVMEFTEELKRDYDTSLRRIMAQHDIQTEFEVWSTLVLSHSKASPDYKFHEEIGNLSKTLVDQYKDAFEKEANGKDTSHLLPYAVAAYKIASAQLAKARKDGNLAGKPQQIPFISFPWVLHKTLNAIAMDEGLSKARWSKVLLCTVPEPWNLS